MPRKSFTPRRKQVSSVDFYFRSRLVQPGYVAVTPQCNSDSSNDSDDASECELSLFPEEKHEPEGNFEGCPTATIRGLQAWCVSEPRMLNAGVERSSDNFRPPSPLDEPSNSSTNYPLSDNYHYEDDYDTSEAPGRDESNFQPQDYPYANQAPNYTLKFMYAKYESKWSSLLSCKMQQQQKIHPYNEYENKYEPLAEIYPPDKYFSNNYKAPGQDKCYDGFPQNPKKDKLDYSFDKEYKVGLIYATQQQSPINSNIPMRGNDDHNWYEEPFQITDYPQYPIKINNQVVKHTHIK